MEEKLKVVYYGSFFPTGIINAVKKYSLYFDEINLVDSEKLLEMYKDYYKNYEDYFIVLNNCKKIKEALINFSKITNFSIKFYTPIEIDHNEMWESVEEITRNEINSDLYKKAKKIFKNDNIVKGMLTGVNIALAKSIVLNSSPITNEVNIDQLMTIKLISLTEKLDNIDFSYKYLSSKKSLFLKYNLANLYGFKIFDGLQLPIANLDMEKIKILRHDKNFVSFRKSLIDETKNNLDVARDILFKKEIVVNEKVDKIKNELKEYEKTMNEKIPKMKSELVKIGAKEGVGIGLLSGLAFGLPIGLIAFGATISIDLIDYYIKKSNLLRKFGPHCSFLFNLNKISNYEYKNYIDIDKDKRGRVLKIKSFDKLGLLASTAATYLFDTHCIDNGKI